MSGAAATDAAGRPARRWRRRLLRAAAAALGLLLLAAAGLLLGLGATREAFDANAYAGPRPLAADVAARFEYPERRTPPEVVATFDEVAGEAWTSRWVQLEATTPGDPAAHLVQVIHYAPRRRVAERAPAVVVSPILGGKNELAEALAAALAEAGLHAAVVLRAESYFDSAAPADRLERVLRTAVIDRRRAVEWLAARPDVDPERIGACGVSSGAVATVLLAAAEPRVRAAALVMGGGDLAGVIVRSAEPRIRRYVREKAAAGVPPAELERRLAAGLVSDPLALAPAVDARRTLVVQTRFDDVVPPGHQDRLWAALGRPERYLLPAGHYSAIVYLPWLRGLLVEFFEDVWG